MNAEQKHTLFERLRYELRMAEGFADEINASGRAITENDAKHLYRKVAKAFFTAEELVKGFNKP